LLAGEKDLHAAQALLARFVAGEITVTDHTSAENTRLWGARKLVESAIHPDTGEVVPLPFRMAGYVPFNGPVCVAMLSVTSTPALLFWGWANQVGALQYCV
jgi:hypothetical protein